VHQTGPKGKTWGPSTMHQKERINLNYQKVFNDKEVGQMKGSKSAPNLDKSRMIQMPSKISLRDNSK